MGLRSSPTPEGWCCRRWSRRGTPPTSAGCDPHRPRRVGAADERFVQLIHQVTKVAILTDPGGSVLLLVLERAQLNDGTPLRSSPTPEGRCCAFHRRPLLPHADHVAILTDPGGSVLLLEDRGRRRADDQLRSSPTPEGRCCPSSTSATRCRPVTCCDPHRPRRVGAAVPQQGDCADHGHPTL